MLEELLKIDHQVFFAINRGLSNPFFDWLMPLLRNRFFWSPLYLFLIIFFIRNYGRRGYMLILFLLLTFAFTDMFSAGFIKHAVERLRPCNDPSLKLMVNSVVSCGSGFSFPSSHATNHFGIAVFLVTVFSKKWKWITPLALGWAFMISIAQVYVGVHFPVDITAGAIIGSIIGYITGTIFLAAIGENKWNTGS